MCVILFNSPTGSADKVSVGKLVACSVGVGQGQCFRLVACPVSWDDGCKKFRCSGHLRFGSADLPRNVEFTWAEVASGQSVVPSVALGLF